MLRDFTRPIAHALRDVVRLTPHDTSTEEGRARERYRRAALITATSFLARGLSASVSVVSIPLTVGYLGKEQYGLWMAISALLTWAVLADFGVARGLQNHLAEANGRGDQQLASAAMSTAFFALLAVAVVLGLAFLPALLLVPWASLFKVGEPALLGELRPTLGAVVAVFLAQFPLNVVGQAYAAYQRSHVANLFSIVGSAASLGVLLVVIRLKLGLPWLILASGGVSVLMTIVNLAFLARDMPWLLPRWSSASRAALGGLMKVSTPMVLIQLGAMLITEVQILTISHVSGVATVAEYSIFQKVISVPILIVAMIESPYPAMYREAWARGDARWYRTAFWRLARVKAAISVASGLALLVVGDLAMGLLSRQSAELGTRVWIVAGVLLVVGNWNGGFTHFFMAVDRLWVLVWTMLANGLVTFPLTYWLAAKHGMFGVLTAMVAFSVLVTSWLVPLLGWDLFRDGPRSPGAAGPPSPPSPTP